MHIWTYAFGGRKGLTPTIKALMYAAIPFFVLGWIPVLGTIIGGIWAVLLVLTGLMEILEMYSGRAILALVASLLVPIIIMGAIAAAFLPAILGGALSFCYVIKILKKLNIKLAKQNMQRSSCMSL
jgi:hypothetical protein